MSDAFKARIADELGQLRGRLQKLSAFIDDDDTGFARLPKAEQQRLVMQRHHMRSYEQTLAARAAALDIDVRTSTSEKIELEPVVLLLAFRYMLGRETYMVARFIELMEAHLDATAKWHGQIVADIKLALAEGRAGAEQDQQAWRRLADVIETRGEHA